MPRWQAHTDKEGLVGLRARALAMATLATLMATCATARCMGADVPTERQDLLKAKPEAVEAWKDTGAGVRNRLLTSSASAAVSGVRSGGWPVLEGCTPLLK